MNYCALFRPGWISSRRKADWRPWLCALLPGVLAATQPPGFNSPLADRLVVGGEPLALDSQATGTPPLFHEWHRDGMVLAGETNAVLSLAVALRPDGGAYQVVVSNAWGVATSRVASVTVLGRAPAQSTRWPGFNRGFCYGLQAAGPSAVGLTLEGTIFTLDVSQPGDPVVLGSVDFPGLPTGMRRIGDRVYVAAGTGGLQIVDVSEPRAPTVAGSANPGGTARNEVFVAGNLAFVPYAGGVGLRIFDLTQESAPTLLSTFPGGCADVQVADGIAYLADQSLNLEILDVSNPTAPQRLGGLDTTGTGNAIWVDSGIACLANGDGGLRLFDVSTPTAPVALGQYSAFGLYAHDVVVSNGLAYLAGGQTGVHILSITNAASPLLVGGYDTPGNTVRVFLDYPRLWVADDNLGFLCLDVSNPAVPVRIGWFPTLGIAWETVTTGDLAFVADDLGILILDTRDPRRFKPLDLIRTIPERASSLLRRDNRLYVSTRSALKTYRIEGSNLVSIASAPIAGLAGNRLRARGDLLFAGAGATGLQIFSLANPDLPVSLSVTNTPGVAYAADAEGTHAFVADGGSLRVVDIADPAQPVAVTNLVAGLGSDIRDVEVRAGIAHVAAGIVGLALVDVSDPARPFITGIHNTPGQAVHVRVEGRFAWVADGAQGLAVVDVCNPRAPVGRFQIPSPYQTQSVAVFGNYALVSADLEGGLQAVDLAAADALITSPPRGSIVGGGDTAPLQAEANGLGGVVYQWYRDGEPIVGATNAWHTASPSQPGEVGLYTVRATDALGTQESVPVSVSMFDLGPVDPAARLMVAAPPGVVSRVEAADTLPPTAWEPVATLTGTGGVQWVVDGVSSAKAHRVYRLVQP